MNSVRTFKSFKSQTLSSGPRKQMRKKSPISQDGKRPAMIERDLNEKPHVDRSEILKKIEENKRTKFVPKPVKGQKLGVGFIEDGDGPAKHSDVGLNNPNDPMTSEKLKSVLQSGAVSFSGKEKEILSKILG